MATITSIERVCATDYNDVVIVKLDDGTVKSYFMAKESNDDLSSSFSKNSTSNHLHMKFGNTIYHGMYESATPYYKSPIYAVSTFKRTGMTYDFNNIFQHVEGNCLLQPISIKNTIYSLSPESIYGHAILTCDSYSYLSNDNGAATLPNRKISTILYNKQVISQLVNGLIDQSSDYDEVKNNIYGITYSSICEMPGNILNDYDSGNIGISTFKTKNQYDSTYTMKHGKNQFENCRTYFEIQNCNSQVYFKYHDNVNYDGAELSAKKTSIKLKTDATTTLKLQHIELVSQMSRFMSHNCHQTNLYRVSLNTDILSQITNNDDIKENIRNTIKTSIYSIIGKLSPANTQIFQVDVKDE